MKRTLVTIIMFALFLNQFSSVVLADTDSIIINRETGTVTIDVGDTDYSLVKVIIIKDEEKYVYNIYSSKAVLPLQMGSGIYRIGIYENIGGKRYKESSHRKVRVKLDEVGVFLQNIQEIDINESPLTVLKAREIISLYSTENNIEYEGNEIKDMEKLEIVYDYVINNIEYDTTKAKKIGVRYLPNVDENLTTGKGICYDYTSLMAVMLRSLDVPTKLVKGYTTYTKSYHSWNEVLIDGEWIIVDATTDVSLLREGIKTEMIKNSEEYKKKYEF